MNGISQKNLLYGILGAMVADKKSDTDAKLPRNELMKAGLLNSIGGGENPMFSMLSAKMSAEDKIKAATLDADNAMLIAKVENIEPQ